MKNTLLKTVLLRTTGVVLMLTALVGLWLSGAGLYRMWQSRPQVTQATAEWFNLSSRTLGATSELLRVLDGSLVEADETLVLLQTSLDTTSGSLTSTVEVVDQVSALIGEDLVGVVEQTQASLVSAGASAKLVDDTLSVIGAIPFIGQQYQPKVPLSRSITEIAFNLGFMNTSLLEMQAGVQASGRKLDDVRWSVDNLSQQVAAIQPSIIQARVQILEYQLILTTLREKNDAFEKELPAWLNTLYTLATVVLVWVVFSQLGLLLQGWQLLAPAWFRQPEEAHEAPVP